MDSWRCLTMNGSAALWERGRLVRFVSLDQGRRAGPPRTQNQRFLPNLQRALSPHSRGNLADAQRVRALLQIDRERKFPGTSASWGCQVPRQHGEFLPICVEDLHSKRMGISESPPL